MTIADDINKERAKLIKVTFGNKLAQKVTTDILMPILDNLEAQYPYILDTVGKWVTNQIKIRMLEWKGTGAKYVIYEYNPDAPRGQKKKPIGTYTAGDPLGPPVSYDSGDSLIPPTGSLAEAVQYELYADGTLVVGLLDKGFSTGREFRSMGYVPGPEGEKGILVGDGGTVQPVGTYWEHLIKNERANWFRHLMIELRSEYREKLRTEARKALNKATRRLSVRRAIVFKVYFK